jgi:epoxyqueuosine reductase QueG
MNLNNEIIKLMKQEDCNIVGFADLRSLSKDTRQNFDYGILLALSYSKEAMLDLKNNDMKRYYEEWKPKPKRLDELATITAHYLIEKGYEAFAKVSSTVTYVSELRTALPYKNIATLAGIGWIGKCAMLVTNEVGSALRIAVVLTNAPLDCGTPITKSLCPSGCNICVNVCPGKAPLGGSWEQNIDRDEFFNASACHKAARDRAKTLLGLENDTLCELCIANCPFTMKALGYK